MKSRKCTSFMKNLLLDVIRTNILFIYYFPLGPFFFLLLLLDWNGISAIQTNVIEKDTHLETRNLEDSIYYMEISKNTNYA